MASPKIIKDIVYPVAVGAIEIGVSAWDTDRIKSNASATPYSPYVGIGLTVLGLGAMLANFMAEDARVVLHAALPQATTQVYSWIKAAMGTPSSTSARAVPVGRPLGRNIGRVGAYQPEFQGLRLV